MGLFFPSRRIFLTLILFFQGGGSWEHFSLSLNPFGGQGQEGDAWDWDSSGVKGASLDGWVFLNFLEEPDGESLGNWALKSHMQGATY